MIKARYKVYTFKDTGKFYTEETWEINPLTPCKSWEVREAAQSYYGTSELNRVFIPDEDNDDLYCVPFMIGNER